MDILPYLSLLILRVILLQEYVQASFDADVESPSILPRRQKRMVLTAPEPRLNDPHHPWAPLALGYVQQSVRVTETIRPTQVEIIESGYGNSIAYAIHPFMIVAHPEVFERYNEYTHFTFTVKSRGFNRPPRFVETRITHLDVNHMLGIALAQVLQPMLLGYPEENALYRPEGFNGRARGWVLRETHKIIVDMLGEYEP